MHSRLEAMADFWRGWLSYLLSPARLAASRLPTGHPFKSPLLITLQASPYQDWNVLIFVSIPSVMIDVVLGPQPLFCHHRLVSHREQVINAAGSSLVLRNRILSESFHDRLEGNAESQTRALGATWWAYATLQPPALLTVHS